MKVIVSALILSLALLPAAAFAQSAVNAFAPPCPSYTDASNTYSSDAQLFAAAPANNPRRGMFVQCLTASCLFALNLNGATASLTAAGNVVINGQYGFYNAASFGFVPQTAVRIIASGSSVITAFACPN